MIRIDELKQKLSDVSANHSGAANPSMASDPHLPGTRSRGVVDDTRKMIALLEGYIQHLRELEAASKVTGNAHYQMPVDTVSPNEWADFDNVYQVHSPHVFIDNGIRDVCSLPSSNLFVLLIFHPVTAAILSYLPFPTRIRVPHGNTVSEE